MSSIFSEIENDISNALAESYRATREFFTTLFTYAGATGREVGELLKTGHFIPFNEAIQQAENQSVANTPVFSGLAKFGIKTGKQLFNAESQLAANIIPISGTFGHLAAHPNEGLGSKISDIAFGLIDIPGLIELADTGRLVLTGADELSPLGKLAVKLGESKAFNYPLLALGIGSMLLPSSPRDVVMSKEYVYKTMPNVKAVLKEVNNTINPKPYDPLALTLPSTPSEEPEIEPIILNHDMLRSYAKGLEERVDESLRIHQINEHKINESTSHKTSSTFSSLYIGITLMIIVFIIVLIMVKA